MRWERLFAELSAGFDDESDRERDLLAEDLVAEQWASTGWAQVLGGRVTLEVVGLGVVTGEIQFANTDVVVLDDAAIAATAVLAVLDPAVRSIDPGPVTPSLGWRHVLRTVTDVGGRVRVHRSDGSVVDGVVDAVGRDFVQVRAESGSLRAVPFTAIVAVRELA